MIADIASGNTSGGDVLFLIGIVLAVIGAVAYFASASITRLAAPLVALAVAAIAFGLLLQ